ncbi:MAG: 5-(carboxyamino)imidazole ribonucleotide mutase [Omnitrophica bacterium RBG_13_46_9]|nr:MAG: 5-(carboxyamino)imidazole ribonucleotide mutase [Omnitrophica bacterium RBG_13_46_9]
MVRKPQVSVIMGSDSDLEIMKETLHLLKEFGIPYEAKILSAHRSPQLTTAFAKRAEKKGINVIIAGAGGAAHLAGVIASHTSLPVIGVPMETGALKGIDSLFSTVQMPSGVPVATVAIGKAGAKNAAILAAEILGVNDTALRQKIRIFKRKLANNIKEKNKKLKLVIADG